MSFSIEHISPSSTGYDTDYFLQIQQHWGGQWSPDRESCSSLGQPDGSPDARDDSLSSPQYPELDYLSPPSSLSLASDQRQSGQLVCSILENPKYCSDSAAAE